MSVFDVIDKINKAMADFEANKGLFQQIPEALNKWTSFQNAIYENTLSTKATAERIEVLARAILQAVDPQMPTHIAEEMIALSAHDPRNQPGSGLGEQPRAGVPGVGEIVPGDPVMIANAQKLAAAITENGSIVSD